MQVTNNTESYNRQFAKAVIRATTQPISSEEETAMCKYLGSFYECPNNFIDLKKYPEYRPWVHDEIKKWRIFNG